MLRAPPNNPDLCPLLSAQERARSQAGRKACYQRAGHLSLKEVCCLLSLQGNLGSMQQVCQLSDFLLSAGSELAYC